MAVLKVKSLDSKTGRISGDLEGIQSFLWSPEPLEEWRHWFYSARDGRKWKCNSTLCHTDVKTCYLDYGNQIFSICTIYRTRKIFFRELRITSKLPEAQIHLIVRILYCNTGMDYYDECEINCFDKLTLIFIFPGWSGSKCNWN